MSAVDDLRRLLQLIPGGSSVNQKLHDFEMYIRNAAREGALEAVPQIKIEVKKTVEPYVYASLGIGLLGLLVGLRALRAVRAKGLAGPKLLRSGRPRYLL